MYAPIPKKDTAEVVVFDDKGKRGNAWLLVVILVFAASLLLWFYDGYMVSGLIRADAMDYAQIGRNVLNGHGLTTSILRPLALTHGSNPTAQPDVTHGPLYPFLLALAFGLFGVKDGVVQAVSGLCFVLTVPMLVFLGQRLFNRTVGILGAIVFMCNPALLQYASEGSAVPLLVFLATCLFFALDRVAAKAHKVGIEPTATPAKPPAFGAVNRPMPAPVEKEAAIEPAKAPLVMVGLLAGLLYLTEPLLLWLLPILVVGVIRWHSRRRGLVAAWMLLPVGLLVLPCMARFGMLTGNPLFGLRGSEVWMNTRAYPGYIGYRMLADDPVTGAGLFKSILFKVFLAANTGLGALQHMPANCILLFVVPGLFFRYGDRGVNRLRAIALACLLGILVGGICLTFDATLFMVVFPILLLYALAYLTHLMAEAKLNTLSVSLASTGLGAMLLFPLIASMMTTRMPAITPEAPVARALQNQSRPDEVSFSDKPWIPAWYGSRPSIWVPASTTGITALRKQFPNARWLFLTPEARDLSREWGMAVGGLMNWDLEYQKAQQAMQTPPAALRITGEQLPLMKALEGFESVPPVGMDTPAAVLAATPRLDLKSNAGAGQANPGKAIAK